MTDSTSAIRVQLRRTERILVIITAYLDEGHTHDASPVTIVGGAMASAGQWEAFEKAYRPLKEQYGFTVFHTRKFKRKTGEFAGWSNEKCLSLVDDLYRVTKTAFMESAVTVLDNAAYDAEYKLGDKPRKMRLDTKYGLCVKNCILHFVSEAARRKHRQRLPKLHCVLESGHKNAGDAMRIFGEIKTDLQGSGWDVLGDLTFADKEDCDPLMAGDFLAHMQGVRDLQVKEGRPLRFPDVEAPPDRREGLTVLRYMPGALSNVRQLLIDDHHRRNARVSGRAAE
jgi:hypothetical protein